MGESSTGSPAVVGARSRPLPEVDSHYILGGIVERKCKFEDSELAETFGEFTKQISQATTVDHQVRHLQQCFVAAKLTV
jgi:hypothetical protein